MIKFKARFEDYTAVEFTQLVQGLIDASGNSTYQDGLLEKFIKITEHPSGSDLIYGAEAFGSANQILEQVTQWRTSNALPGLKKDTAP